MRKTDGGEPSWWKRKREREEREREKKKSRSMKWHHTNRVRCVAIRSAYIRISKRDGWMTLEGWSSAAPFDPVT